MNAEATRQHEAHKAISRRIWGSGRRNIIVRRFKAVAIDVTQTSLPVWEDVCKVIPKPPTIMEMAHIILGLFHGVTIDDVRSPKRTDILVRARYLIACAAKTLGYSLAEIGRFLRKHHTTIMYLLYESKAAERFGSNAKVRG